VAVSMGRAPLIFWIAIADLDLINQSDLNFERHLILESLGWM
jgi:hypothetical protein